MNAPTATFADVGYDEALARAQRARAGAARARGARRGGAPDAARDRGRPASHRPPPLRAAEALRRHGARLRVGRRHPGRARARLPVHRLERRQPRHPPLDARALRRARAGRGVGREPRCAHRLGHRVPAGARAQGGRRVLALGALELLERRRPVGVEHARGAGLRRRPRDRLPHVPRAPLRVRDRRRLERARHARDRLEVGAGEGRVRPRVPRARHAHLPRRRRIPGRARQPEPAVPDPDHDARLRTCSPARRSATRRPRSSSPARR